MRGLETLENLWKTTFYSQAEVKEVVEILGGLATVHRVELILRHAARLNTSLMELARITVSLLSEEKL